MYLAWTLVAGIPPGLVRFGSIKMTRSEAVTFRRLLLTRFALIPDFNGKPDVPLQPILIAYRKRFVRPRVRLGSIRDSFRVHSGSIREPFGICSGSVGGSFVIHSGSDRDLCGIRRNRKTTAARGGTPPNGRYRFLHNPFVT